jgi:hypothetical protein
MIEIAAGAIANLALQKFVEMGAGKAAEKLAEGAVVKLDNLRQMIWAKLRGQPPVEKVKAIVEQKQPITQAQIDQVAAYLQVAMDSDPKFAKDAQMLAHEITLMQVEDNSSMNQTNYGGTNYQTKTGDNNTNIFGTQNNTYGSK